MQIQNIAGYKFISLDNTSLLRDSLSSLCAQLKMKGTILLSTEGININLAAETAAINKFISFLQQDSRLDDISFKMSYSASAPFKRLKVKIKEEIITMRQPASSPLKKRAPDISPEQFKQWLDEKRDLTILDTRNNYEVQIGTFENAVNLQIDDFCEFPKAAETLDKSKPIVMFCTGGIRCEKAAVYLLNQGVKDVYQLDGGILNYFEKVGGAHYQGDCFVFDDRIAVNPALQPIPTPSIIDGSK